jgi:ketosteroid isomerase-like protein
VLLAVAILVSVNLFAQQSGDVESRLLAMENAWNAAQRDHDVKAMDALVAETFIDTEWDGSVLNKAQFLQSTKDPSFKFLSLSNDNVSVFSYGNTAIVAGTYHLKATKSGKPYEAHGRFTDTWMQLNGKWQCVASATTHIVK